MSLKNPLTPAGIEPATFRFVAQHLNHCATAVPNEHNHDRNKQTNKQISLMLLGRHEDERKRIKRYIEEKS